MSHDHDDTRERLDAGSLDEVRALPRAIEPERDLWPGIAARLERPAAEPEPVQQGGRGAERDGGGAPGLTGGPGRSWQPWQLAAAAVLVAVLGGTGFGLLRLLGPEGSGEPGRAAGNGAGAPAGTASADATSVDTASADPGTPGGAEPATFPAAVPGAEAFGGRLLAALERKRSRLGPETSDAVEADITRLGLAVAELLTALAEHPESPALYHHLAARQRQEADLLLRLNQL